MFGKICFLNVFVYWLFLCNPWHSGTETVSTAVVQGAGFYHAIWLVSFDVELHRGDNAPKIALRSKNPAKTVSIRIAFSLKHVTNSF